MQPGWRGMEDEKFDLRPHTSHDAGMRLKVQGGAHIAPRQQDNEILPQTLVTRDRTHLLAGGSKLHPIRRIAQVDDLQQDHVGERQQ